MDTSNKVYPPFPILSTKRLTLRRLSIDDAQKVFILRSDSEINKYLDRQISTSFEDAINFIRQVNENIDENNALYWGITILDTNKIIGAVSIFNVSIDNEKCEIGYELLTNFQNQGIMKEAVEKVIDYTFHTKKIKRIEAFLHIKNQRSINLLEKLCFKKSTERNETNTEIIVYHLTNSN